MKKSVSFLLAVASALVVSASIPALAQGGLATSDAQKFMGAWTLGLDTPQGAMSMNLTIKDNAGKVAGSITSDMAPDAQAISDISKDGENLVLKYELDVQGQSIPAMITLVPDGDKWKASFDFAGGQFVMDGTAVKK